MPSHSMSSLNSAFFSTLFTFSSSDSFDREIQFSLSNPWQGHFAANPPRYTQIMRSLAGKLQICTYLFELSRWGIPQIETVVSPNTHLSLRLCLSIRSTFKCFASEAARVVSNFHSDPLPFYEQNDTVPISATPSVFHSCSWMSLFCLMRRKRSATRKIASIDCFMHRIWEADHNQDRTFYSSISPVPQFPVSFFNP